MSGNRQATLDDHTRTLNLHKTEQVLTEQFEQLPALNLNVGVLYNLNYELSGTNATSGVSCVHDTVGTGLKLISAAADNDQVLIFPHQDANQTAHNIGLNTSKQPTFQAVTKTGPSVAGLLVQCGLVLTTAMDQTTDADQAKFVYDTDNHNTAYWRVATSIGGVDAEVPTDVAITADTAYVLKITVNADREAEFWINDKKVYTSAALTANIDLKPFTGIQALAAGAHNFYVRNYARRRLVG